MRKFFLVIFLLKISLIASVFEHLLNQDRDYLFEHNFRCHDSVCISPEKNIFDQDEINQSVKFIKVVLDHQGKVFQVRIALNLEGEPKEAFYNAVIQLSDDNTNILRKIVYNMEETNDKYGNHSVITITDDKRSKDYIEFLIEKYKKLLLESKK